MKKVILGMVLLITLTIFSTCKTSNKNKIDFEAQYLRTRKHEVTIPITTVINSRDKLDQYYEDACPNDYYPDENIDYYAKIFWEAIEKYTDDFFIDYFLVIVLLNEVSGSIRHEVKTIDEHGEIIINRLLPGKGKQMTTDLAEWHIVIKLNRSIYQEKFSAKIIDKVIS